MASGLFLLLINFGRKITTSLVNGLGFNGRATSDQESANRISMGQASASGFFI
jgi:hypothetical protein